jgi:ankyrin repeat protein
VLAAGANPNLADRDGVSPLTHAMRKGRRAIARLIEAAGGGSAVDKESRGQPRRRSVAG